MLSVLGTLSLFLAFSTARAEGEYPIALDQLIAPATADTISQANLEADRMMKEKKRLRERLESARGKNWISLEQYMELDSRLRALERDISLIYSATIDSKATSTQIRATVATVKEELAAIRTLAAKTDPRLDDRPLYTEGKR